MARTTPNSEPLANDSTAAGDLADERGDASLRRLVAQERAADAGRVVVRPADVVEVLDPCEVQAVPGELVLLGDGRAVEQPEHRRLRVLDVRLHLGAVRGA